MQKQRSDYMAETPSRNSSNLLVAAIILGASIVAGGFLLGDGLKRARLADRAVTVRGLAERDVTADLATWTLRALSTGSDFAAVQADAARDAQAIRAYLGEYGFKPDAVQTAGVSVSQWNNNGVDQIQVRQQLRLRTTDVAAAQRAHAGQAALLERGVALEDGGPSIVYSFTRLNAVKPAMIAAATKDARRGAEQFAKDSGAEVGGIKSASQGYFSIQSRDGDSGGPAEASPEQKLRVVTTVDFYLSN
jgi:hypothetical protein